LIKETEILVRIGEDGSDSRRIDRLTAELRDLLGNEPGCRARHAERTPGRASSKGPPEIVPGAITLVLAVTANLRMIAVLLAQWVHRDDGKHLSVRDTEHGAEVDLSGMNAAEIEIVLTAVRAGDHGNGES
jgi:Effector Associated Constant Component 1